jgi:hypothetical protein
MSLRRPSRIREMSPFRLPSVHPARDVSFEMPNRVTVAVWPRRLVDLKALGHVRSSLA